MNNDEKIPFEKIKADVALAIGNLFIKFCEEVCKQKKRKKAYLTLAEIREVYRFMYNMYYDDRVELLEEDK